MALLDRNSRTLLSLTLLLSAWLLPGCGPNGCGQLKCPEGAILIPAATFEMGTNEKVFPGLVVTPHQVTLTKPYCMDRTEVTQKAYLGCQGAGACPLIPGDLPTPTAFFNWPKDVVSWQESVKFCNWRGGRLPTEAEWEFAARGTDGRFYPWGNEPPTARHWQWQPDRPTTTSDVGTHPEGRSFFGLEDMSGNLAEFVSDTCGDQSAAPDVDPQEPDWPFNRAPCYVVRGAAWSSTYASSASACYRAFSYMGGDMETGFRCAYAAH